MDNCQHCKKPILHGERKHFSKQAGMRGPHHWECFISACRQANKQGEHELAIIIGEGEHEADELSSLAQNAAFN